MLHSIRSLTIQVRFGNVARVPAAPLEVGRSSRIHQDAPLHRAHPTGHLDVRSGITTRRHNAECIARKPGPDSALDPQRQSRLMQTLKIKVPAIVLLRELATNPGALYFTFLRKKER